MSLVLFTILLTPFSKSSCLQGREYQYTAIDLRTDWVAAGAPFNAPVGTNALVTQYVVGRIKSGDPAVAAVTTLDQVHTTLLPAAFQLAFLSLLNFVHLHL